MEKKNHNTPRCPVLKRKMLCFKRTNEYGFYTEGKLSDTSPNGGTNIRRINFKTLNFENIYSPTFLHRDLGYVTFNFIER